MDVDESEDDRLRSYHMDEPRRRSLPLEDRSCGLSLNQRGLARRQRSHILFSRACDSRARLREWTTSFRRGPALCRGICRSHLQPASASSRICGVDLPTWRYIVWLLLSFGFTCVLPRRPARTENRARAASLPALPDPFRDGGAVECHGRNTAPGARDPGHLSPAEIWRIRQLDRPRFSCHMVRKTSFLRDCSHHRGCSAIQRHRAPCRGAGVRSRLAGSNRHHGLWHCLLPAEDGCSDRPLASLSADPL